jgi:hypothetical protein
VALGQASLLVLQYFPASHHPMILHTHLPLPLKSHDDLATQALVLLHMIQFRGIQFAAVHFGASYMNLTLCSRATTKVIFSVTRFDPRSQLSSFSCTLFCECVCRQV